MKYRVNKKKNVFLILLLKDHAENIFFILEMKLVI